MLIIYDISFFIFFENANFYNDMIEEEKLKKTKTKYKQIVNLDEKLIKHFLILS